MEYDNILDTNGDLVEERISTVVRGTRIILSASILNAILKIDQYPLPNFSYSNREVWSILKPGEPFPEDQTQNLTIRPSSMNPRNRILWYIFSRNFIQKGGNFTHFAQRDYPLFTAFVNQTPFNIGHHIFQEMVKFKFPTRKLSHMPFPSLISVILFYFKVWYVGSPETLKYPPYFGKVQLNLMNLNLGQEGSGQSRAPRQPRTLSRSRTRVSQSRGGDTDQNQEAQSAPPPTSTLPSDFDTRVKEIVQSAVAAMRTKIEYEVGKLRADYNKKTESLADIQDAIKEDLIEINKRNEQIAETVEGQDIKLASLSVSNAVINDKLEQLLKHFNIGSSSAFGTSAAPSSSRPPAQDPASSPLPETPIASPIPLSSDSPSSFSDPNPLAIVPYIPPSDPHF